MNKFPGNISIRTLTTVVTVLIGAVSLLILIMGYLLFEKENTQEVVTRFASTTPLPSAMPSQTLTPMRITPDILPASVTSTPTPPENIEGEPASQNNGMHPTFMPTDQPCENCHQNLGGSN